MSSYRKTMREALEEMLVISGAKYDLDEEKMSSAQIAKLKKAYEPMRDKRISTDNANKLSAMMDKVGKDKEALIQLFKADIPFVSQSAVTKLISKHGMKGAELNKLREEVELDEAKYDLYHKDFSSAMQHAYKMAKKLHGITVDPEEIDDKVASGPRKPSEGKTNSYRLKGDKGAIQVQVYNKGGSKPFELNMYKEEVDLDEASSLAQQAAIAISKKERGGKSKKEEVELDEYGGNFGGGPMRVTSGKKKKDKKEGVDEAAPMATSKQDATTQRIRKRMKDKKEGVDEAEDFKPHKMYDPETGKAYDVKTMEDHLKYKKMGYSHEKPNVEESAASDARRAIALDPSTKQKFSKNVSATDDDVKSADKNVMMQMRKAVSLRGNKVEFMDKKKVEIPQKIAQAVLDKYNSQKRPADKEKFQTKVSKSYKDMLQALKETNEKMDTFHEVKSLMRKFRENDNG